MPLNRPGLRAQTGSEFTACALPKSRTMAGKSKGLASRGKRLSLRAQRSNDTVTPDCDPGSKLIGVGTAGYPAAPPSEPYVRISRIRLSGWWFTAERIDRPDDGLW